jgi:rhamnulokinase
MSNLYVACELGAEKARIFLGVLHKEGLTISSAGEFRDLIISQEERSQWDVSRIYEQVIRAMHGIVAQEEPVRGLTFFSGETDALLFETDVALLAPATRTPPALAVAELKKLLAKVPAEELYAETGLHPSSNCMMCQLAAEPSRRLKRTLHAMPLPDTFNFLFSRVPQVESSQAAQTRFYNPVTKVWSERLLKSAGVPARILPPVIAAGTTLGKVCDEVAHQHGLEDASVVATCSYDLAASLAPLSILDQDAWAFLFPDQSSLLGTVFQEPYINDISREMGYSNLPTFGGSSGFFKTWVGLRLVDQCRLTWSRQDRALDTEVLMHLATSAPPFEAFIDPADPRFQDAEDLPQAIQAYCRETGQEAPRKPGSILRCVLESLALQYRKGLQEMEYITGGSFSRIYLLGGKSNLLLTHFLANALQIPVVVVPPELPAFGNVVLQALALGHITSIEETRSLIHHSLKLHTINPHASAWTEAYDRFLGLKPAAAEQI